MRNNGRTDNGIGIERALGQVASVNVIGERSSDCIRKDDYMSQPWPGPIMLMIIGIDISVFERDAMNAIFFAFATSSAVASTIPSTFF